MQQPYWDTLEWIKTAASMLQRHAIPADSRECLALRLQVEQAKLSLAASLNLVQPYGELWAGAKDDPLRLGRILAADWDALIDSI